MLPGWERSNGKTTVANRDGRTVSALGQPVSMGTLSLERENQEAITVEKPSNGVFVKDPTEVL